MKYIDSDGQECEIFAPGKRYIVENIEKPQVAAPGSSIIIPDNAQMRVQTTGIIRELGTADGPYIAEVGDRVICGAHAGASFIMTVKRGDRYLKETWRTIREEDISAVLKIKLKNNKTKAK